MSNLINSYSLSSVIGIGTDTPNQNLTVVGGISGNALVYDQTGNSSQWNSVYTSVKANSGSYATSSFVQSNYLNLTGGTVNGNVTFTGNISAQGTAYFANTIFTTSSAISAVVNSSGPALYVSQLGSGDLASFYDFTPTPVEVLHVGASIGIPGVGIYTSTPNKELTVVGEISATKTIYALGGNSSQWNAAYQSTLTPPYILTGTNSIVPANGNNKSSGTYNAIGGGENNCASGAHGFIGAGDGNCIGNNWSFIGNGEHNRAYANDSGIVTGSGNYITTDGACSFIGGGQNNSNSAQAAVVAGGQFNTASGYRSGILGGASNTAACSYAIVVGGANNTASSTGATIVGGNSNCICTSPTNAVITGGSRNTISSGYTTTIGGGESNNASGDHSVIAGGCNNSVSGNYSAIVGGENNCITPFQGDHNFIGGGISNTVSGYFNSIVNGNSNTMSTYVDSSTIASGILNSMNAGDGGNYLYISESTITHGCSNCICATTNAVNEIGSLITRSILGGNSNTITAYGYFDSANSVSGCAYICNSAILNGIQNYICGTASSVYSNQQGAQVGSPSCIISSLIVSGSGNKIVNDQTIGNQRPTSFSTIVNGSNNCVCTDVSYSTVVGGYNNISNSNCSFIAGGYNNNTNTKTNTFILGSNITASQPNFTYVNNLSSLGSIYSNGIVVSPYAGMRNRIINGDFYIDQRKSGANSLPASTANIIDRWKYNVNGAPASKIRVGQNANAIASPAGFTSYYGLSVVATSSPGGGDYVFLSQVIEGPNTIDLNYGTSSALSATLSFYVRSSRTGNFGGFIRNYGTFNRSYPFLYNIPVSNTWTYITVPVPGDTTGTWSPDSSHGIEIGFEIANGSTYQAAAGAWTAGNYTGPSGATTLTTILNSTFYVTGVQFEPGIAATPYERRNYGIEYAMCQRYYEILEVRAGGYNTTGNNLRGSGYFRVQKRPSTLNATVISTDESSNLGSLTIDNSNYRYDSVRYITAVTATGDAYGQWQVSIDSEF